MSATGSGHGADQPELADSIVTAVLTVDGVTELHGGLFGEVATYLPGRRVPGVRINEDGSIEVHVVIQWGTSAPHTADAIRRVVSALVPGEVHVTVEDVATAPTTPSVTPP